MIRTGEASWLPEQVGSLKKHPVDFNSGRIRKRFPGGEVC